MNLRRLALVTLALCALGSLVRASRLPHATGPRRFPWSVVSPGPLPSLWTFVRDGCPHCKRHIEALQHALARLPRATRERAGAHTHLVGNGQRLPDLRQHSEALRDQLSRGPVPCTWWVDADTNVSRIWVGTLGEETWDELLVRLLKDVGP